MEENSKAIATQSLQFEIEELQRLVKTMQRVQQGVEELAKKQQRKRGPLRRLLKAKTKAQDTSQQLATVQEVSAQIEKLNECVRVGNKTSGKLIGEPLLKHEDIVISVTVNADGQTVVSSSMLGEVIVWCAATGMKRQETIMHEKSLPKSVSVSSNGLMFVIGS